LRRWVTLPAIMMKLKQIFALALLPLLSGGCHTVTNLTPSTQARNASGVYPVEVKFDHRQQAIRQETVQPYVMINENFYPMDRTRLLPNRWETLIPVPAGQNAVYYRFKIEYEVNAFPQSHKDSKLSDTYKLTIKD
jgi:hypothetical protein